jgi:hypothetical protein
MAPGTVGTLEINATALISQAWAERVKEAAPPAGLVAHRQRVAAEEAMSSAQRHAVGARVEVRDLNGSDWHAATVLAAWDTNHYGWVYRVRYASGIEHRVTGQRVRAGRKSRA